MRCEVRPPLIAMLAAQRVEQPVRIASVTVVNTRTAVGDVIDGRRLIGGEASRAEYPRGPLAAAATLRCGHGVAPGSPATDRCAIGAAGNVFPGGW